MEVITAQSAQRALNRKMQNKLRAEYRDLPVGDVIQLPRIEWQDKSHPGTIIVNMYRKVRQLQVVKVRSDQDNYYITKLKEII